MNTICISIKKCIRNKARLRIASRALLLNLIFFFSGFNLFAQTSLVIHQSGFIEDSIPQFVIADYPELSYRKINDSTLAYLIIPPHPQYLFLVINDRPLWKTRVWISPETEKRELFINYANHTVTLKNQDEWDKTTDRFVTLIESGKGDEADQVAADYVNKNPDSFLSLWFLTHGLYREKKNLKKQAFLTLSPALETYPDYNQLKMSLLPHGSPKVGDVFEEFTLNDKHDSVFTSSAVSDKWILLHFWSNQCAPCVKEMDSLVSFYNSLDTSRIAFISVALDNEKGKWKSSGTANKIKWVSLWEDNSFYGDLCRHYNVDALPYFIIFDKSKKINLITFGNELELVKATLRAVK